MDINSIESNNWYIKASGDINANDVTFNNIFLAGYFSREVMQVLIRGF